MLMRTDSRGRYSANSDPPCRRALRFASDELKAGKGMVLAAVAQSGYVLECASVKLKADKEVVLCAVALRRRALQYFFRMSSSWTRMWSSLPWRRRLTADKVAVLAAVAREWIVAGICLI
jgi:hypothetical protein